MIITSSINTILNKNQSIYQENRELVQLEESTSVSNSSRVMKTALTVLLALGATLAIAGAVVAFSASIPNLALALGVAAAIQIAIAVVNIFSSSSKQTQSIHKPAHDKSTIKKIAEKGYIGFYKNGPTAFLGNFYETPITYKGYTYQNAEAAFQAQKFPGYERNFVNCRTGDEAFKLKQKLEVSPAQKLPPGYHSGVKNNIMLEIVRSKFKTNAKLKKLLLDTGSAYLVEHNVKKGRDSHWSDDSDGTGRNMLGELLMIVRSELGGTGIVSRSNSYNYDLARGCVQS